MHDIDRTQLELTETGEFEQETTAETSLGELEEIELATELLEVSNEHELEQFLGNVLSKVGGAVGSFVRSDTGRALTGILKNAAKQALPVIGRGIGAMVSPSRGGAIGQSAGKLAAQALGLELEGLSHEDREFEVSRQFVRFAAAAARKAARAQASVPAAVAALQAATSAAQTYAPGLLPRLRGRSTLLWPHTGRWTRRGRTIVLYGG